MLNTRHENIKKLKLSAEHLCKEGAISAYYLYNPISFKGAVMEEEIFFERVIVSYAVNSVLLKFYSWKYCGPCRTVSASSS
jgi:hypothetical protein